MTSRQTKINGLVLAGGKSKRMGRDKSSITWHGKEQRYYIADLLQPLCDEVFISLREDQENEAHTEYKTLTDSYTGIGPYGAILSAFKFQSDVAWLVVACDLPLLNSDTLQYLLEHRDVNSMATTFQSPFDGLPEPLITIWEPKSYSILLDFLSNGYTCPRKVLIKSEDVTTILQSPDLKALMNVNTPEDFVKAEQIIQNEELHNAG